MLSNGVLKLPLQTGLAFALDELEADRAECVFSEGLEQECVFLTVDQS